jgi:hypothetical protein
LVTLQELNSQRRRSVINHRAGASRGVALSDAENFSCIPDRFGQDDNASVFETQ